ncbi:ATP-binding protein [Arthrospiribacter ruber]|uniref:histidine kinase n=1 Tax=Arthrospiribacter ruber TaxID=2487934 RepID=A0A951IYZ1_9BACT|nr:ATP-binding protein [Arthrospiribacter ruber]MBW3468421.1 PAS domain-containing sensor histidine kinase [Arthrospiribacter ruber]
MVVKFDSTDYNELFHKAPCGYLKLDAFGKIITVNDTFCNWLGFNKKDLLFTKSFQDLLSIGGKMFYETHFLPLLQLRGEVSEVNFELLSIREKRLPFLVNAVTVFTDDGQKEFNITLFDISQRISFERELIKAKKEAESNAKRLEEKNRELERFTHIVTHDLKSPVRTIEGLFEIMSKKGYLSEEKEAKRLQKMVLDNLRRMKVFIDDLVDQAISENETEYGKLIDLNQICHSAMEMLGDEIKKDNVKFSINPLPIVKGNVSQLVRLFSNLFSNSIKYRSERPLEIEVSFERLDTWAEVKVKDNGIGFDPEFKERIFEYMKRLHSHEIYPGSGIGLYSCKRIVEAHGGKIWAEGFLDKGAVFHFTLPLA